MTRTALLIVLLLIAPAVLAGEPDRPFLVRLEIVNLGVPPPGIISQEVGAVADLDGDGRDDLVFTGWRSHPLMMVVGSGSSGELEFKQALLIPSAGFTNSGGIVAHCPPAPPRLQTIVHLESRVEVFAGWPLVAINRFSTQFPAYAAVCADVDANGSLELIVAEQASSIPRLSAYDPLTGTQLWTIVGVFEDNASSSVVAAQLDSDPAVELIWHRSVIDGATRLEDWNSATSFAGIVAAGNLDLDPQAEFLSAGRDGSRVTAFGSNPYSSLWELPVSGGVGGIATGDIVPGAPDEVIVANRNGLLRIHDALTRDVIRSIPVPSGTRGAWFPVTGDFNGNGTVDVAWSAALGTSENDALIVSEGSTGASIGT